MSRVDLKVVLLGKEYTGKTCLVERFIYDRFNKDCPYQGTIGAAFGARRMEMNGEQITLGLWDTAGSERYETLCRTYYRGAAAAIICYDLCDVESFEKTKFWVSELWKHEEGCRIYLCGTKLDLVQGDKFLRKVDYYTASDYADEINSEVFETSSKMGTGVSELFNKVAEDYLRNRKEPTADALDRLSLEVSPARSRPKCC